jgi:hypothetical protein
MDEATWQQTAETVRAAYADGDLTGLAPLLAPDVRWHGTGPGGCPSAAEVLAWITDRGAACARMGLRLHRLCIARTLNAMRQGCLSGRFADMLPGEDSGSRVHEPRRRWLCIGNRRCDVLGPRPRSRPPSYEPRIRR